MRSPVAVLFALLIVAGAPSAVSAATVAQPGAQTAVREHAGTIVFSTFDATDRRWHLTIRRAGASAPERLPVASSVSTFAADIGTDTSGRPQLIYQRCSGTAALPSRCDLFVYSLTQGTGERPVRNANDASRSDRSPTLWRGRIAWTREYGTQVAPNPVVYTKTLSAPRSQPSTRLPGVPQRRCGDVDRTCGPTTGRRVEALELWGDNLAVTVDYGCKGCSGIAQTELRLVGVAARTSRQVARQVIGLNGQQLVGSSFFDGRLAWYRSCTVNDPSCRTFVGPWRYRLSGRTYDRGPGGPRRVDGYADTGGSLYEVAGCDVEVVPQPDCRIDRVTPPTFTAVSPPVF